MRISFVNGTHKVVRSRACKSIIERINDYIDWRSRGKSEDNTCFFLMEGNEMRYWQLKALSRNY